MFLLLCISICSFVGNNGFVFDPKGQHGELEQLQKCMTSYSNIDNNDFVTCMGKTSRPDIDLCSLTLNGFQCNLDFILKTCPSSELVYKQFNYYTVRACNSTFDLPGNNHVIVSSSDNNRVSVYAFGLAVVVSFVQIVYVIKN